MDPASFARLLDRAAAAKATVMAMMMGHALANGVVSEHGTLQSPLSSHWLAWAAALRRGLMSLGLAKRGKQVLDLSTYVAQRYSRPADDAERNDEPAR